MNIPLHQNPLPITTLFSSVPMAPGSANGNAPPPPQPQQPPQPMDQEMYRSFMLGMVNFVLDVSDSLYLDGPYFGPSLMDAAQAYRQAHPQSVYERFGGSRDRLQEYLQGKRRLQAFCEQEMIIRFNQEEEAATKEGRFPPPHHG